MVLAIRRISAPPETDLVAVDVGQHSFGHGHSAQKRALDPWSAAPISARTDLPFGVK